VRVLGTLLAVAVVGAMAWAAMTVDLGGRTALGHARARGLPWLAAALGDLAGAIAEATAAAWDEATGAGPAPEREAKRPAPTKAPARAVKPAPDAPAPTPPARGQDPVAVQAEVGAAERVARLRAAEALTLPAPTAVIAPAAQPAPAKPARAAVPATGSTASVPARTRTDERISEREKAALDALLVRREGRPR
jgi:hypothetical protein